MLLLAVSRHGGNYLLLLLLIGAWGAPIAITWARIIAVPVLCAVGHTPAAPTLIPIALITVATPAATATTAATPLPATAPATAPLVLVGW
jgi:hypothetical protein